MQNARTRSNRKVAQSTLVGVELPPDMFKYSSTPLRVALSFVGNEDFALGLWSSPYMLIAPDFTVRSVVCREEHGLWVTRQTQLSAVQYNYFIATGEARTAEWKADALDMDTAESIVRDELEARRYAWIAARDGGIGNGDGQLKYAHDVYLVWGARMAVCLGQEWEIRRRGMGAYTEACARGELPWQRTVQCIRRMLAE